MSLAKKFLAFNLPNTTQSTTAPPAPNQPLQRHPAVQTPQLQITHASSHPLSHPSSTHDIQHKFVVQESSGAPFHAGVTGVQYSNSVMALHHEAQGYSRPSMVQAPPPPSIDANVYQKYGIMQQEQDVKSTPSLQSPSRSYRNDIRERSITPVSNNSQSIYRNGILDQGTLIQRQPQPYHSTTSQAPQYQNIEMQGAIYSQDIDGYANHISYPNVDSYKSVYYTQKDPSMEAPPQPYYTQDLHPKHSSQQYTMPSYSQNLYPNQYTHHSYAQNHLIPSTSQPGQISNVEYSNAHYEQAFYRNQGYTEDEHYYSNGYRTSLPPSEGRYMASSHPSWNVTSQNPNSYHPSWNRQQNFSPTPKPYSLPDQVSAVYDQGIRNPYSYPHNHQEPYVNYSNPPSRSENVYQPPPPTSDTALPPLPVSSSQTFSQAPSRNINNMNMSPAQPSSTPLSPLQRKLKSESTMKKRRNSVKDSESPTQSVSPEPSETIVDEGTAKKDRLTGKRKRNIKDEVDADFELKHRSTKRQKALAKKKQNIMKMSKQKKSTSNKIGKRRNDFLLENFVEFQPLLPRSGPTIVESSDNFTFSDTTFEMFADTCVAYNDTYHWLHDSFIERCTEDAQRRYDNEHVVPSQLDIKKVFRFMQWNLRRCLNEREKQLKLQPMDRIRPSSWHLKSTQLEERKILEVMKYGAGIDVLEMLFLTNILKISEKDIANDIAEPNLYRLADSSDDCLSNVEFTTYVNQSGCPNTKRIDTSSFLLDPSEIETDLQLFGVATSRFSRSKRRSRRPPTLTPLRNGLFERIKMKDYIQFQQETDGDKSEDYQPDIDQEEFSQEADGEKVEEQLNFKNDEEGAADTDYTPTDSNDSLSNDDNFYNTRQKRTLRSRRKKSDTSSEDDNALELTSKE